MTAKEFEYNQIEKWVGKKESEIEELFFNKIDLMMSSIFNEEVLSAQRQYTKFVGIIKVNNGEGIIPKRGRRMDIYCECKSGNKYAIEVKCTNDIGELMKAIGQLLFYSEYFKEVNKLVLVSNHIESIWYDVVKRYKLPIEFVLIGKNQTFTLKK